jgi:hypothetical protein
VRLADALVGKGATAPPQPAFSAPDDDDEQEEAAAGDA